MSRTMLKILTVFMLTCFVGLCPTVSHGQTKGKDQTLTRKQKDQAQKLFDEGTRALNAKDYQLAASKFGEGLQIWPANGQAHFKKAQAHHFLGDHDQAITEYDLSLTNGQKPIEVYRQRWESYEKAKKYDEALADLTKVLETDPNNQQLLQASANLNYEKGNYVPAADAFMKLAATSPNGPDLYYRAAVARSKAGDLEGQAAAAELAISKNTQFLADALILLGDARRAQKRIPEAIDAYTRALNSRPDKPESYRQLADLYRTQNRIDEGVGILENGRRQNPTNGDIYADLSLFYSLLEKKDEAIATGRSATQLVPNSVVAHTNLCRAYFQADKPELAISSCNMALKLSPEDGEALFYLGRATSQMARRPNAEARKAAEAEGYYKRAVASLQAATKARPGDAEAYYMLGNAYADLQQNTNAIEAYRKVLELNPKLTRANFNIGVIQLNGNNKAGAMEQYNVLLQSDKNLAEKLKSLIDRL